MDRMTKNGMAMAACAALASVTCAFAADDPINTVWNAQKARAEKAMPANAARVRALGAKGDVAWFAVPAMSDVMRLQDTWPIDGKLGGTVRTILAQDEWESASFQLFAFKDLDGVELKVEGLPFFVDLHVVKLWFQNGNAWVSYFDDAGLKLVPELLLHDENLIRVETKGNAANWARVRKDGKDDYVWISPPKGLKSLSFNPFDPGFADAPALLPVKLEKNAFKQFFLTYHPAKDQKPGVYKGSVKVTRKGATLAEIPLAVRVLPFQLPLPRGYKNLDEKFVFSCMGAMPSLTDLTKKMNGDEARAKKCFRAWLQSTYDHSLFYAPSIGPRNEECLPLLKEIGYPLDPVFGETMIPWFGHGPRMSYAEVKTAEAGAEKCVAYYDKLLGHHNILAGHGDEPGPGFVTCYREFYPYFLAKGVRIGTAGHISLLVKGGYAYGMHPKACSPDRADEQSRPWLEIDPDMPIGFYAAQHTGSENPQFTRRQHGLLGYFNGLTMAWNYLFEIGSFNDRNNTTYKPMVIAYANGDGLMETIEYAGYREACDDIRYATALKLLCREVKEMKDAPRETLVASRQALQYMALLEKDTMDLNNVRLEMIRHILKLRGLMGK